MDSKMKNLLEKINFDIEKYSHFDNSIVSKIIVNREHTKYNIIISRNEYFR